MNAMTRCFLVPFFLIGLVMTAAADEAPAVSSIVDRAEQITLDNGLRVFVLEETSSPTFAAYYQFNVGGASDPKGRSGIAHLLEHMMFKGTRTLGAANNEEETEILDRIANLWDELHIELDREADPFQEGDDERKAELRAEIEQLSERHQKMIVKNEYDEVLTRAGGVSMNASTSNDVTNYYIQLPANRLEFWFRLEADRLLHPVFRNFYSERDVVHEERRLRTESNPSGLAWESLQSLMFSAHPYGTPVVGWPQDLLRLTRRDAEAYFTTYYSPSNCVMVLVGDIRAEDVKRLAKKHLGPWQRQEIPRLQITTEPPQRGERRRVVEFDSEPQLMMSWVTVPEGHPDQYPLDVLATIMGGLWSSRLDRTIVLEEKLASSVYSSHPTYRYAGYFTAQGSLRGEKSHAELEAAIEREVRKIQEDGVTTEELERAKILLETGRVRRLKSNLGLAFQIGSAVGLAGGLDYIDELEQRTFAVTAADVKRVAAQYLKPKRKNVVEVRKTENSESSEGQGQKFEHQRGGEVSARGALHSEGFVELMKMVRTAEAIDIEVPMVGEEVHRVKLENGATVFIQEDRKAPSVEIGFSWLGGSNAGPIEELAAFELAGGLLREGGTEALTPVQLEERREELGMTFWCWMGSTQSGATFWSLERNFEQSFELVLDVLTKPRFDSERFSVLKTKHVDQMRRRWDYPSWASAILQSHILDHDHPRLGYQASKAEIEALEPDQIRELWNKYIGIDNLYLTVVGDFDEEQMLAFLEEKLTVLPKAESSDRVWITRDPVVRPGVYVMEKEISAPSIRFIQHLAVDRQAGAAEHAALEILNDILGGSGFRSRLMERLRSDEGLTYGIYSSLNHEGRPGVPGSFRVSYQTKKDSVAQSINTVIEECEKIIADEVSSQEVEEQIEAWRNRFIFKFTNTFYSVNRLMRHELDDRSYDRDQRVLDEIQKVTAADVHAAAKKIMDPSRLTISIFGVLTVEDRAALEERFGKVQVLAKETVFSGGFWEFDEESEVQAVN